MDFKIVTIGSKHVLLERIEGDAALPWQVIISTYRNLTDRYDEWAFFKTPQAARQFILDYTDTSARQFLSSAESSAPKKTAKAHA